jgi:hypothetical protein
MRQFHSASGEIELSLTCNVVYRVGVMLRCICGLRMAVISDRVLSNVINHRRRHENDWGWRQADSLTECNRHCDRVQCPSLAFILPLRRLSFEHPNGTDISSTGYGAWENAYTSLAKFKIRSSHAARAFVAYERITEFIEQLVRPAAHKRFVLNRRRHSAEEI